MHKIAVSDYVRFLSVRAAMEEIPVEDVPDSVKKLIRPSDFKKVEKVKRDKSAHLTAYTFVFGTGHNIVTLPLGNRSISAGGDNLVISISE